MVAGARELGRKFDRLKARRAAARENRWLKEAEIHLGLLGWQQAEYFTTEIQDQVQRLMQFESEEAAFVNLSAELAEKLRALETRRAELQRKLSEMVETIAQEVRPLAAQRDALRGKIADREEAMANFDKAIAELERDERTCEATIAKLMAAEHETMEIRSAILRTGDRRIKIETEEEALTLARERSAREIAEAKRELERIEPQLAALEARESEARSEADEAERRIRSEISGVEDEKAAAERKMHMLDREKANPYLLIGRCLADSGVAPLNQPEALAQVYERRLNIDQIDERIASSLAESGQVADADLWKFYLVLCALVLIIVFIIWILAR